MIGIEELQAVQRVIESKVLSGYIGSWGDGFYGGAEIQALEKEWAAKFNVKHAIAVNSATSGLYCACAAIGLKPYVWNSKIQNYQPEIQEVLVTPYSMSCSASMPLNFGANPVFVDIEKDYFCMDADKIEEQITKYTKAIIVVNLFGMPYNADKINAIAKKHGIYVIEDNSQGIGAKYKGKYTGTLGDVGVFSLNVHKHIQCGEGGIVVTDNDELAMKIRKAMNHSEAIENTSPEPHYNLVGMNMRMTELSATVAREQLKKLDGILKVYQDNAKYFPIKVRTNCESAYYKYAYTEPIKANKKQQEELDKTFNFKQGYITPIHTMPLFRQQGYEKGLCPVCEETESKINLTWFKNPV